MIPVKASESSALLRRSQSGSLVPFLLKIPKLAVTAFTAQRGRVIVGDHTQAEAAHHQFEDEI